jgi:hypothetical protein
MQAFSSKKKDTEETDIPDEVKAIVDADTDKKIAAWVKDKYEKCKSDTTGIRNQWYINLAFYKGDQYVQMIRGQLINTPEIPNRVRLKINKIRPAMRTQVSRMTSQKPSATVIPSSSEDEDILAAEAGESVWEHLSESEEYQKHLINACWWASNTGVGYIKQEWDKSFHDEDANEGKGADGKIKYSSPTPFHIHVPNLLERDIEDQPFVIHAFTLTLEQVKNQFGDKLDPEHKPTVVGTNEIMETKYLNLKGSDSNAQPDSCLVMECWVKPGASSLFPKGGMVIVVDDTVVYKTMDGIPYKHKQYPFSKIDDVLSGGYYSTSVIEDLIPLQKEFNRNRSQSVEVRNILAKPGFFVQEGAVDLSKWKSTAGQLIPVKPGFQNPVPIQFQGLPATHNQDLDNIKMDFEDISGQHQVSKGSAPSGVTAGTAISFLQEQDQSFMAPTYTSIELATQKTARQSLVLAVQYWDEPRLVKATGIDQIISARFLSRSDIKNGTDIRMEAGSSLPVSKAARNAFFMDLINRGIIPGDKGLELLNLPNMRSYYAIIKVDENQATRENIRLRQTDPEEITMAREDAESKKQEYLMQMGFVGEDGQPDETMARQDPVIAQLFDSFDKPMLPVNDWDSHEVHIYIHQRFMKSQAFENMDPAIQDEFIRHVEEHKAVQQSQQLTQLMMGGTTGGQPEDMGEMQMPGMPQIEGGQESGGGNQFSGIEGTTDPSGGAPVDSPVG